MKAIQTNTTNAQTLMDLKHSVLIVSVVTNLFVLTTWLVVQVS